MKNFDSLVGKKLNSPDSFDSEGISTSEKLKAQGFKNNFLEELNRKDKEKELREVMERPECPASLNAVCRDIQGKAEELFAYSFLGNFLKILENKLRLKILDCNREITDIENEGYKMPKDELSAGDVMNSLAVISEAIQYAKENESEVHGNDKKNLEEFEKFLNDLKTEKEKEIENIRKKTRNISLKNSKKSL
jgi:hypothetical protein